MKVGDGVCQRVKCVPLGLMIGLRTDVHILSADTGERSEGGVGGWLCSPSTSPPVDSIFEPTPRPPPTVGGDSERASSFLSFLPMAASTHTHTHQ